MATDTLSLVDLTHARTSLLARVEQLKSDLATAEGELNNLTVLIGAFEIYAGISSVNEAPSTLPTYSPTEPTTPARTVVPRTTKKRIPSTEMVGELVRMSKMKLTREDIRDRFKDTYGFPESWANPVNALNNAIARAVDRGLIQEFPDGTFAAPDQFRNW